MRWRVDIAEQILTMIRAAHPGLQVGDQGVSVDAERVLLFDIGGELRIPRMGHLPLPIDDDFTIDLLVVAGTQGRDRVEAMQACGDRTQSIVTMLLNAPDLGGALSAVNARIRTEGWAITGPHYNELADKSGYEAVARITVPLFARSRC